MRISNYALEKIGELEAAGIRLTPVEVLRLNALGLRVESPAGEGNPLLAGRVAWAGEVAFYEPTIQSSEWYINCACKWWSGGMLVKALAWACSRSRDPGAFDVAQTPLRAWAAVQAWWLRLPARAPEVVDAVTRVIPEIHAAPDPKKKKKPAPEKDDAPLSYHELVRDMVAYTGIPAETWRRQTVGEVEDVMRRWLRQRVALAGGKAEKIGKREYDQANMEFNLLIEAIEKRSAPNGQ